jgi:hypothetical protein
MKRKVLTGRYSFHEFKQVWKVAKDPYTKTYDIYNRRTKETEQVKALIKGNEESATSMLVLESLAKSCNQKIHRTIQTTTGQEEPPPHERNNGWEWWQQSWVKILLLLCISYNGMLRYAL